MGALKKTAVLRGQDSQTFLHEDAEIPKEAWNAFKKGVVGVTGVTYAEPVAGSQVYTANALMGANR